MIQGELKYLFCKIVKSKPNNAIMVSAVFKCSITVVEPLMARQSPVVQFFKSLMFEVEQLLIMQYFMNQSESLQIIPQVQGIRPCQETGTIPELIGYGLYTP